MFHPRERFLPGVYNLLAYMGPFMNVSDALIGPMFGHPGECQKLQTERRAAWERSGETQNERHVAWERSRGPDGPDGSPKGSAQNLPNHYL